MDKLERRDRIRANLGIEPINHGQVYTFQIAIPDSEKQDVSLERRQVLEDSLTEHKTNLVPLIVRRTEAYSEEEEYEVVSGIDWCLVAKGLDIEKLWVWVFDMTDEQAAATKAEMEQLLGSSNLDEESDLESLLDRKLKPIAIKLSQLSSTSLSDAEQSTSNNKLEVVENKVDQLVATVKELTTLVDERIPPKPPKLNLIKAEWEDIDSALDEQGANTTQRKAALAAINFWKSSGKGLTWRNLEKSVKSKDKEVNIKNFGEGIYKKLKEVADIPN